MRNDMADFFPSIADKVPHIDKMRGKNVLVVGASGLIGNHVLAALKETGCYIFILRNTHMPFVITNSIVYHGWKALSKSPINFDYIFYLAGYGQPQKFMASRFTTTLLNTKYLADVLDHMAFRGHILFASTAEVYSGLTVEATEDMIGTTNPSHPRASYIEGKRCGESLIHSLNELTACNGKIARISLSYGPGVQYNDTRVMSDFIRMGLEDGVIKPKGGLSAVRNYCYVSDTVTMLFNIMLNGKSTVYNVGGNFYMTLRDMLYDIAHDTDAGIEWAVKNGDESAPPFVGMSMDKYYDEFHNLDDNFPSTDWDTGLKKTIEWFKYLKENR